MTLKNRGRSKKTEGRTRPKSKGGSLAVGTYLQRGSAPPPPGPQVCCQVESGSIGCRPPRVGMWAWSHGISPVYNDVGATYAWYWNIIKDFHGHSKLTTILSGDSFCVPIS